MTPSHIMPLPDGPTPPPAVAAAASPLPANASGAGGAPPERSDRRDPDEIDPLELLRILRRRWGWAMAGLVLVLAGTYALFRLQVPQYEAHTTLRFDVTAPQGIPGLTVEGLEQKNELATEMVSLMSFALARDVAETVRLDVQVAEPDGVARGVLLDELDVASNAVTGLYTFAASADGVTITAPNGRMQAVARGARVTHEGLTFRLLPGAVSVPLFTVSVMPIDRAVERLQEGLAVSRPNRDAAVLEVRFRSPDVGLAKLVPDAVARRFIDRQTRRRRSGGVTTADFIAEQLESLELQLAAAESRLRDWRERNRVVQPMAEASTAVEQRAQYEAELARTIEQVTVIEGLLRGTADMPATVRALPGYRRVLSSSLLAQSQAGSSILASILRLEGQRGELLGTVTERDPQVQLLDRTLADYERQGEQFVQNYLSTRRSEVASLQRLLGTVGRILAEVPGRDLELKTLERDVEVLSSLQLVLRQRLKESEISNASELPTVEVLDAARLPGAPVAPVASRFALLGVALGVVTGAGLAFVRDGLDRTIHTTAMVQRVTGALMVGLIPSFRTRQRRQRGWFRRRRRAVRPTGAAVVRGVAGGEGLITVREPRHVSSEAYRTLRANLRVGSVVRQARVLAVTSPSPGDGKSTTVSNLAVVLAMQGERVLVIDTDLRRGTLHKLFAQEKGDGLAELLAAAEPVAERVEQAVRQVLLHGEVRVDVLSAGTSPENPTELLGGERWRAVLAWARTRYDAVLFDTPPVNMFADALVAAVHADGALLVVRAGKSREDETEVAATQVRALGVPLAGVVLNDFNVERDGRYGNYRYYKYYYTRYYDHYATPELPEAPARA